MSLSTYFSNDTEYYNKYIEIKRKNDKSLALTRDRLADETETLMYIRDELSIDDNSEVSLIDDARFIACQKSVDSLKSKLKILENNTQLSAVYNLLKDSVLSHITLMRESSCPQKYLDFYNLMVERELDISEDDIKKYDELVKNELNRDKEAVAAAADDAKVPYKKRSDIRYAIDLSGNKYDTEGLDIYIIRVGREKQKDSVPEAAPRYPHGSGHHHKGKRSFMTRDVFETGDVVKEKPKESNLGNFRLDAAPAWNTSFRDTPAVSIKDAMKEAAENEILEEKAKKEEAERVAQEAERVAEGKKGGFKGGKLGKMGKKGQRPHAQKGNIAHLKTFDRSEFGGKMAIRKTPEQEPIVAQTPEQEPIVAQTPEQEPIEAPTPEQEPVKKTKKVNTNGFKTVMSKSEKYKAKKRDNTSS